MFKRKSPPPKWFIIFMHRELERGVGQPWRDTRARIEAGIRKKARGETERAWLMRKLAFEEKLLRWHATNETDGYWMDEAGYIRVRDAEMKRRKSGLEKAKKRRAILKKIDEAANVEKDAEFFMLNNAWFMQKVEPIDAPWEDHMSYAGDMRYAVAMREKKIYRVVNRQLSAREVRRYGLDDLSPYVNSRYTDKYARNKQMRG